MLALAIGLEVCGTTCMKLSDGFSKPIYTGLVALFYLLCFWALSVALRTLPVGVVYAIWSGVGTVLVAIVGLVVFREPMSALKAASIGLIVAGVAGLQYSLGGH